MRVTTLIHLTTCCVSLLAVQALGAEGGNRVALVIGNAAYQSSPLVNPVNDARAVTAKLKTIGFEVITRENLTQKQIGATLREFRSRLSAGAEALFFYAGHGLQVSGINYLPAIDADISSEEDVSNQSLSVNQVLDVMDSAKTRLNLVFLDACRNNPYSRRFRSIEGGLAKIAAPSGTKVSFATRPGSVASDGDGTNGLYTEHLLLAMEGDGLSIEQALKKIYAGVKKASKGKQEPWSEGEIEGDFYFSLGNVNVSVAAEANPVPAPVVIELELWRGAQATKSIEAYEDYLTKYPLGQFAGQVKAAINKIKEADKAAAAGREQVPIQPTALISVQTPHEPQQRPPEPGHDRTENTGPITDRYRDNEDGTVTDMITRLQWMRCSVGQTWDGRTCQGKAANNTWGEAQQAPKTFAGYSDWRMPSIDELKTLIYCSNGQPKTWNDSGSGCGRASQAPTIVAAAFPNTPSSFYWSRSSYTMFSSDIWLVSFNNGSADGYAPSSNGRVRLVRGAK